MRKRRLRLRRRKIGFFAKAIGPSTNSVPAIGVQRQADSFLGMCTIAFALACRVHFFSAWCACGLVA